MKFDIPQKEKSIIKVVGVGGGGGNAVGHMFKLGITGVDFAICNTDAQALENNPVPIKIALGPTVTEGRGAGSKPEVGKQCCIESIDEIRSWLEDNTKMLFITAGMGGGTGTGAAPIIAKAAKEMGILTVAIVTLPFKFEGLKRQNQAHAGLEQLKKSVDALLVISNDKLKSIYGDQTISDAFTNADNILATAAKGISEIITLPGQINVDFEDVNTVMRDSGVAIMGTGSAEGDDRAQNAITMAMNSPLLEDSDIRGAKHILLNITSGTREITMSEIGTITEYVQEEAGYGTDMIWGHCNDPELGDEIMVTVIATGFTESNIKVKTEEEKPVKVALDPDEKFEPTIYPTHTIMGEVFDLDPENEPNAFTIDFGKEDIDRTVEKIVDVDKYKKVNDAEHKKKMEDETRRRERLRKETCISLDNPNAIADLENTPAYARRNVVLQDTDTKNSGKGLSTYTLNMDDNNSISLSNNSFLYDNVD